MAQQVKALSYASQMTCIDPRIYSADNSKNHPLTSTCHSTRASRRSLAPWLCVSLSHIHTNNNNNKLKTLNRVTL